MVRSVCLNMIVKNEAHVIARCLTTVIPHITSWVIVDTGSTDGTQELVRTLLAGIPGHVVERPWVNFGANRTEALEFARATGAEYAFVIDADEEFTHPEGYEWPELVSDSYMTVHTSGTNSFFRTQLMRLAMPWRFVGVLHEVAICENAGEAPRLEGPITHGHFDSARNTNPIEKYRADAAVLEEALRGEPGNCRYVFYLAQSYRDCGDQVSALYWYQRRYEMGGWDEERWYALFQVAVLKELLGHPAVDVCDAYLNAFSLRPSRAEPLVSLARYYRLSENYGRAFVYAKAARGVPVPNDLLFLEVGSYTWRPLDELAVAAYWVGEYELCLGLCSDLLEDALRVPESERGRIAENGRFAREKLGLHDASEVSRSLRRV